MESGRGSPNQEREHWTDTTVAPSEMEVEGPIEGAVELPLPPGSPEPSISPETPRGSSRLSLPETRDIMGLFMP